MTKAMGGSIPEEHMKPMAEVLKFFTRDCSAYREAKVFFASSAVRMRKLVKSMVKSQKCVQEEMKRVALFVFNKFLPSFDLTRMSHMTQFWSEMKLRPEFSDCSLYQLTQADFGMASSFLRLASEQKKKKKAAEAVAAKI